MKEARYLVVGGSSGIGLEIAMQLRRGGGKVTVVSRSRGGLPEASGVLHVLLDAVAGEIPADTLCPMGWKVLSTARGPSTCVPFAS